MMRGVDRAAYEDDAALTSVRSLPVPELLLTLLRHGSWRHPGDESLARLMPWFRDPLVFLTSVPAMEDRSKALDHLVGDASLAQVFRFARSAAKGPVELPWLDVDHAFFIAVAQHAGDETAVALDYRTGAIEPRVVASDVWTVPGACHWQVVAETFTAFAAGLGLSLDR